MSQASKRERRRITLVLLWKVTKLRAHFSQWGLLPGFSNEGEVLNFF